MGADEFSEEPFVYVGLCVCVCVCVCVFKHIYVVLHQIAQKDLE